MLLSMVETALWRGIGYVLENYWYVTSSAEITV